jgi:phosphoserine phosphatase
MKNMKMYRIVVFDLDGTIFEKPWNSTRKEVAVSTWDALFDKLGIYDLHERLAKIFVEGGFKSYMEWTHCACCAFMARGLDIKTFNEVINSRPYVKGAKETFEVLKRNGIITAVISGSFEELALRAKNELGIDHILAHCRLEFDEKTGLLKDWHLFATDWKDKIKFVSYIADLYKAKLEECVYVGDDVNDIPVFDKVGLSIAFNATKRRVMEAAKVVIKGNDLRKILPFIGLKGKS